MEGAILSSYTQRISPKRLHFKTAPYFHPKLQQSRDLWPTAARRNALYDQTLFKYVFRDYDWFLTFLNETFEPLCAHAVGVDVISSDLVLRWEGAIQKFRMLQMSDSCNKLTAYDGESDISANYSKWEGVEVDSPLLEYLASQGHCECVLREVMMKPQLPHAGNHQSILAASIPGQYNNGVLSLGFISLGSRSITK